MLWTVPFPRYNASGGVARSTLHSYLFPITPIELGEGFVIGSDRLVTTASGQFHNAKATGAAVYIYADCLEVARTSDGPVAGVKVGKGEVTIELTSEQQAVVVWEV